MSRLTRFVDEIEARLAKATRGPWRRHRHPDAALPMVAAGPRGKRMILISDGIQHDADADLIAAAPTDLARAAELLRMVAEAGCDKPTDDGRTCIEICTKTYADPLSALDKYGCTNCRVNARAEAMLP